MKVVFIADNLTTQSAGIHVYTKQFIKKTMAQYPSHTFHHITTEPYEIEGSYNEILPINKWIPGHYRLRYYHDIPTRIKSIGANVAIEMAHFGPFRLPSEIKRVTVVHDLTPNLYPEYHDMPSVLWHKNQFGKLLRSVDAIVCNSVTTKEDIVEHLGIYGGKINICYPAVVAGHEQLADVDRSDEPLQLLTVGTVEPRKNHLLILEALTKWYDEQRQDFRWVVAGSKGWKSEPFYQALESSPIKDMVEMRGYVDDYELSTLYQESDLFLFASHYEGFGLPILEAMGYGLCVVLSDTKIHREVGGAGCTYFGTAEDLTRELTDIGTSCSANHLNQLERLANATFEVPYL